jgi:hypothetical protein
MLERQFDVRPRRIECDNELFTQKPEIRVYLENKHHIEVDPSPPYTQDLKPTNARESGGVVKDKARAMGLSSKSPADLWPEITRAAVYLHNRSPSYTYNREAPHDRFRTDVTQRNRVICTNRKPPFESL